MFAGLRVNDTDWLKASLAAGDGVVNLGKNGLPRRLAGEAGRGHKRRGWCRNFCSCDPSRPPPTLDAKPSDGHLLLASLKVRMTNATARKGRWSDARFRFRYHLNGVHRTPF